MNLIIIMLSVFILVIVAYCRVPRESRNQTEYRSTSTEIVPQTKTVEVEIIDEMTKEKVRNLYEEQEVCNARILYLMRQNKQYEHEIDVLDNRVQQNLNDMRTQLTIQPNMDIKVLKASFEQSNQNIYKHKLKLEGLILTNAEKIVSLKKKSNAISEQITKIGKEVYVKQRQM